MPNFFITTGKPFDSKILFSKLGIPQGVRLEVKQQGDSIILQPAQVSKSQAMEAARNFIDKFHRYRPQFVMTRVASSNIPCVATTCHMVKNGRVRSGVAVCSPYDLYCELFGKALALSRASGEPLPYEIEQYIYRK